MENPTITDIHTSQQYNNQTQRKPSLTRLQAQPSGVPVTAAGCRPDAGLSRKRPHATDAGTYLSKKKPADLTRHMNSAQETVYPPPETNFDFLFDTSLQLKQPRLNYICSALDNKDNCKLTCKGSTLYSECTPKDLFQLAQQKELNDSLITLTMSLCDKRQHSSVSVPPRNVYLSPLFYTGYVYPQKSKITPVNLEGIDSVFLPVNIDGFHWILLIADLRNEKFLFLDSLLPDSPTPAQRQPGKERAEHFRKWLSTAGNVTRCQKCFCDFSIENLGTTQQNKGSNDCGVAVVWAINRLSIDPGTNLKHSIDYPYTRARTDIYNSLVNYCDLEVIPRQPYEPTITDIDQTETTQENPIVIDE